MTSAPRESAVQRIKVGIFCIVLVLLVVSISNVMLKRDVEMSPAATYSEEPDSTLVEEEVPEDPLAEMGATPSVEPESEKTELEVLPDAELDGPNTTTVE